MGRGIFSGVVWASLVSIVLLWMLSQLGGMIHLLTTPPQDVVTESPIVTQNADTTGEATPEAPAKSGSPATDPSRSGAGMADGVPEKLPVADTEPAAVPATAEVTEPPALPSQGGAPKEIKPTQPGQPRSGSVSTALMQPGVDDRPDVAIADVPVATAQTPPVTEPLVPEMPGVDEQGRPQLSLGPVAPSEPSQPAAPVEDTSPVAENKAPIVQVPEQAAVVPEESPLVFEVPGGVAEEQPAPEVQPEQPEAPVEPQTTAVEPQPEPQPQEPAGDPSTVRVNRLPTIGAGDEPEAVEAVEEVVAAPAPESEPAQEGEEPVVPTGPAIEAFAAEFDNSDNRPLMAIVLIDEGDLWQNEEELREFPFPVSYVIDANREDAVEAMKHYRAAGREVVALAPLPVGAKPTDVETSFQTYLNTMTEVVAVMDTKDAVFQSGRQVTTHITQILAESGHGLITYSRGMNSAVQLAARAGVPARLVFREFDNDGQDNASIKRFLDQAAFRAGQQSGVILVGHNRPATLAAIIEWGLGNRADTVALAPVSAALQAQ